MEAATQSPPSAPLPSTTGMKPTAATVSPEAFSSLSSRMQVNKNVVDELLLVCGVIGTAAEGDQFVPVTDCLNWLQDLQRALRRDEDLYRPISLLLGQWKVVPQKLLPLVMTCRYDTAMVLTVCKILVILTKPLAGNTVRAAQMVIDTKKTKSSPPEFEMLIAQKIKLRENALAQCNTLLDLKHSICHHPSHYGSDDGNGGLLSIFVSLLAEPLSKAGTARTDADHLTIELVLHLFRNLLAAESLLGGDASHRSQQLHNDLIVLLEQEMVLEILFVLAADLEARENQPYNLMVMELVHHMLKHHDPTAVARANAKDHRQGSATAPKVQSGRLKEQLLREKQSIASNALTRHSRFGGTLVVEKHGRKQIIPVVRVGEKRKVLPAIAKKRRNKRSDPFVSGTLSVHDEGGPSQQRAMKTINIFCERFVRDCYGPFTKSVKNEFRRESARLEDADNAVFFRIIWFFCQWWRVSGKNKLMPTETGGENRAASESALGQLIFTMDIYTFNLVLKSIDSFLDRKHYARLAQSVAVYSELTHLLHVMYNSPEQTEQIMAMGLMNRLFYASEPLDRLPKLLSRWIPGTCTREYLCDLAELTHMTLKVLDESYKKSEGAAMRQGEKQDKVDRMRAQAAEFDVGVYFGRKIVSNQMVFMYTQLLSRYASNAPHVNHRIIALFLRLGKHKVVSPDASPEASTFLLRHKVASLEPMLYNVHLLNVIDKILNDMSIRRQQDYASLLSYAASFIFNFAQAAKINPVLFVEALFKQPHPHRFSELTANMYVNDELRQIAERDLYMEEGKALEQEELKVKQKAGNDSESSDDELEFDDSGITGGTSPTKIKKLKKRRMIKKKRIAIDSDNASSGEGSVDANEPFKATGTVDKSSLAKDSADTDSEGEQEMQTGEKSKSRKKQRHSMGDEDDDASKASTRGNTVNAGSLRFSDKGDDDSDDGPTLDREQRSAEKFAKMKKAIGAMNTSNSESGDEEVDAATQKSTAGIGRSLYDGDNGNDTD
ncbi:hypothetical protein MPSEU_001014800 [Mayamaea pseudoterrestris]|nr:hypothetical protein MPSEU_001014800 [Mayamaea pseudoterrestris]